MELLMRMHNDNHQNFRIKRVSLPKARKKGILMFLEVGSTQEVAMLKETFKVFNHEHGDPFKICEIAPDKRPHNMKEQQRSNR
eukprot:UN08160